jgi:hypothetical protein
MNPEKWTQLHATRSAKNSKKHSSELSSKHDTNMHRRVQPSVAYYYTWLGQMHQTAQHKKKYQKVIENRKNIDHNWLTMWRLSQNISRKMTCSEQKHKHNNYIRWNLHMVISTVNLDESLHHTPPPNGGKTLTVQKKAIIHNGGGGAASYYIAQKDL